MHARTHASPQKMGLGATKPAAQEHSAEKQDDLLIPSLERQSTEAVTRVRTDVYDEYGADYQFASDAFRHFNPPRPRRQHLRYSLGKLVYADAAVSVYNGLEHVTGRLLTVKQYAVRACSRELLEHLDNESRILCNINHPNVERVFDIAVHTEQGFGQAPVARTVSLLSERVLGRSLRDLARDLDGVPEQLARRFARQLLEALAHLHRFHVAHMDVRCANAVVTASGVVKLIGFSLALRLSRDEAHRVEEANLVRMASGSTTPLSSDAHSGLSSPRLPPGPPKRRAASVSGPGGAPDPSAGTGATATATASTSALNVMGTRIHGPEEGAHHLSRQGSTESLPVVHRVPSATSIHTTLSVASVASTARTGAAGVSGVSGEFGAEPMGKSVAVSMHSTLAQSTSTPLGDERVSAILQENKVGLQGSVYWLAPELLRGGPVDILKSDIWSFGCAVYEMLVGKPPFHECKQVPAVLFTLSTLREFVDIPDGLSSEGADFLRLCLAVDPLGRASADTLLGHPWVARVSLGLGIRPLIPMDAVDDVALAREYEHARGKEGTSLLADQYDPDGVQSTRIMTAQENEERADRILHMLATHERRISAAQGQPLGQAPEPPLLWTSRVPSTLGDIDFRELDRPDGARDDTVYWGDPDHPQAMADVHDIFLRLVTPARAPYTLASENKAILDDLL